jgi:peptide deformylase
MNLLEAQKRLAEDGVSDHYRYFIDTYRIHDYKEETLLKEYIDYIIHEPLLWMQSFPAKLKSKPAFSKPKTAILKLLKDSKVVEQLGAEYCDKAHDLIDHTYKQHGNDIVAKRMGVDSVVVTKEEEDRVEPPPTQAVGSYVHPTLTIEEDIEQLESDSSGSISLVEEHRELEKKYRVLKKAYETLLKATLPEGQYNSVQLMMNLL